MPDQKVQAADPAHSSPVVTDTDRIIPLKPAEDYTFYGKEVIV